VSRNRQKIERYGSAAQDSVTPVTQEPGRRTIVWPPHGFAAGQSLPNIYRSGPNSSSARSMHGNLVARVWWPTECMRLGRKVGRCSD